METKEKAKEGRKISRRQKLCNDFNFPIYHPLCRRLCDTWFRFGTVARYRPPVLNCCANALPRRYRHISVAGQRHATDAIPSINMEQLHVTDYQYAIVSNCRVTR